MTDLSYKNIFPDTLDANLNKTFIGFLNRFYSYLFVEKDFSSHTIRAYLKDTLEFLLFLQREGYSIHEIDVQLMRSYFTEITGSRFQTKVPDQRAVTGKSLNRKLSPRSQGRKLSSLKTFFRLLIRDDIITESPLIRISSPRFYRRLPALIKQDIMFDLLESKADIDPQTKSRKNQSDHLHIRDRAIYELLYSTGMRISELLSIEPGDIRPGDSRLKIRGKGGNERIVFIGSEAGKALEDYMKIRNQFNPGTDKLFLNSRGTALDPRGVRYRLSCLQKKMGLAVSLHPHKFRHSFATDLLNSGADIRAVQEMLGHKSISSTQIYMGVSKDRLREIHRNCHPHGKISPKNY